MRTAVLTVFYPGMRPFMEVYLECINGQTDQDFELVVVNDAFPESLNPWFDLIHVVCHQVDSFSSPQQNRLVGLEWCRRQGFDLVICSDSDETMYPDRVERVKQYFSEKPEQDILFINSVASIGGSYFDLDYKSVLCLNDVLDFNVLGYGAMNLRASLIPFLLSLANERVIAFDWWIGLQYLLHNENVEFLSEIRNHYTLHPDNFVGPVLELTVDRIAQSIKVKHNMFAEMHASCVEKGKTTEATLFFDKRREIEEVENYIKLHSMQLYFERVKNYLDQREKIFWWQEAVPLPVLKAN